MIELTTFGAVMKFAIELEETCIKNYEAQNKLLYEKHKKRKSLLEKIRRERLNEILLEPITGLNANDYEIKNISEMEEKIGKFYADLSKIARAFSPEVSRIFEKLSAENISFKAIVNER
ncbi:MAG: hypothetical protein AB1779_01710 [Candidatus Thermoplasmatota archaeon]